MHKKNRQTDRQTDTQTDRHTDMQVGRQTGRQTDRKTEICFPNSGNKLYSEAVKITARVRQTKKSKHKINIKINKEI